VRLLEGSPAVLSLMDYKSIPVQPRFVRAVLFDYRFTDSAQRRKTGEWWRTEQRGLYCPVMELGSEPIEQEDS